MILACLDQRAGQGDEETEETSVDSEESVKKAKGCQNFEVVAILGHELGHWKKNHTLFHIVFAQVSISSG
jgi:STE24 endopeptidase